MTGRPVCTDVRVYFDELIHAKGAIQKLSIDLFEGGERFRDE